MELITSQTNRWLKCAMQLKHRKYRDKFGLFVMEGIRSVYDANAFLQHGMQMIQI